MARDDQYVLNHCTTFLARDNTEPIHDFGYGHYQVGDPRACIREAWRFPIVDSCFELSRSSGAADHNDVTFVYPAFAKDLQSVSVLGTFAPLYQRTQLRRIYFCGEETSYWAVTIPVPRRSVFLYKFVVDEKLQLDPVNPQQRVLENGVPWSRFFTWECSSPIVLQRWQLAILERFCDHILPFRTIEGQRFLSWYYEGLSRETKSGSVRGAFRLEDSVGASNYIDKILAREESHHLTDYDVCLKQLDRIVRMRDPGREPANALREVYVELYKEMAADEVNGWDYAAYGSPRYFLQLLRRHAFTGAFSHPKYGGNVSQSGWAFLENRFPFNWRQSLEAPLGTSLSYHG